MTRTMSGSVLLLVIASAFAVVGGCSKDEEAAEGEQEGAAAAQPKVEPQFDQTQPAAVPADQPGAKAMQPHMNLQNLVHLADVDHQGLFVDFGTPSADKYMVGGWNTGFGASGQKDATPFAYVEANLARLYLPIDVKGDAIFRFRLNPIGTGTMQVYLNNEQLPVTKLDKGEGFNTYDVKAPAAHIEPGENYLLLRFGDTVKQGGKEVSVAMDWMRVMQASAQGTAKPAAGDKPAAEPKTAEAASAAPAYNEPRYASLVRSITVGDSERKALSLSAPASLSWHVQVPSEATLSFRVGLVGKGSGNATITVTPEGGAPQELMSRKLEQTWDEGMLSLAKYAGQVVRLELAVKGTGKVAWSSPSIMVPVVKTPPIRQSKNTVVLLIDTLRASKLRVYNKRSSVKTPVLDKLASEGTVFENAQSPENWTKPSVASVLTSLFPLTHMTKRTESKLPDSALMVSEVFQKAGFKTASFLANGYVSNKFGFDQGWDHYTNYIREGKSTEAENVFREAGKWIEKNKDQRFFVYIQTIDPHVPYDPPKEFLDMYDAGEYSGPVSPRKTPDLLEKAKRNPPKVTFSDRDRKRLEALHDAEISYHDKHLGEFIEKLKKLGLYRDMMFVVTSDHGEEFHEHGSYGHGHSVYQEMIQVPMMFRQPDMVPAGKRVAETVSTMDIAPTVLTAAGVSVPEVMEGYNRMGHILGQTPPRPSLAFSDFLDDRHVVRAGRWKLVLRGSKATLFDLEKDPGEKVELPLEKHPVAMRYCRIMLGQFLGAEDKGKWLEAAGGGADKALEAEDTEIDSETRGQLKALGYAN